MSLVGAEELAMGNKQFAAFFILVLNILSYGAAFADAFEDGASAIEQGDYVAALRLFYPLAQSGDPRAEYLLGSIYEDGNGVPQNLTQALNWYRKAAQQGFQNADVRAHIVEGEMPLQIIPTPIPDVTQERNRLDAGVLQSAVAPGPRPENPAPASGNVPQSNESNGGGVLLVIILLSVGGILVTRWIWREFEYNRIIRCVQGIIQDHVRTLARKRSQTLYQDDYGNLITKGWEKEIIYFRDTVVHPALTNEMVSRAADFGINLADLIETEVYRHRNEQDDDSEELSFSPAMLPTDYEQYCANLLQRKGWDAQITKASGDQGSDVIAEKPGMRIVLQCKLYTQPVGNKAVQEVYAAQKYEQADHAAVVTNETYTPSARKIAMSTGIALLHHTDVVEWAEGLISGRDQTDTIRQPRAIINASTRRGSSPEELKTQWFRNYDNDDFEGVLVAGKKLKQISGKNKGDDSPFSLGEMPHALALVMLKLTKQSQPWTLAGVSDETLDFLQRCAAWGEFGIGGYKGMIDSSEIDDCDLGIEASIMQIRLSVQREMQIVRAREAGVEVCGFTMSASGCKGCDSMRGQLYDINFLPECPPLSCIHPTECHFRLAPVVDFS